MGQTVNFKPWVLLYVLYPNWYSILLLLLLIVLMLVNIYMSHLNMLNAFNEIFEQVVRYRYTQYTVYSLQFTVIEASQCIVHDNIYGLIIKQSVP